MSATKTTRLISGCRGLDYQARLNMSGLISLEEKQTRGNLIQVFKLIKGFDKLDYRIFFTLSENNGTRGQKYKINKERSRLELRKNSFSQRVVNVWNRLPSYIVEAESINSFKNKLDDYWRNLV